MGYTASKLIAIAREEIGYLEKKTNASLDSKTDNAGSNNYTKYARDLHNAGYYQANKNGYEWCEVFNDWCHWIASGKDAKLAQEIICQTGVYGAGCTWSAKCYREAGRWYTTPMVGDQAYFGTKGNEYHTGIVSKVTADKVYIIEGNTSGASSVVSNGGGVCEKSYPLGYAKIAGYGRPRYDAEVKPETTTNTKGDYTMEMRYLKKGCKGDDVRALQILLIGRGYSCGSAGTDGDFGSATDSAVRKYQKAKGLAVDGIVGKATMGSLLGTS